MTRKEIKEKSQDMLMAHGQLAFLHIYECPQYEDLSQKEKQELVKELDKQFTRMEKLFGYKIKSWSRNP